MRGVLADAGLDLLDLPPGLRLRRRGNLTFAINYGPEPEPERWPEPEPWPLREGATPVLGDAIVEPQDVAAWQS